MTHYELLQVSPEASIEVIEASWKALMRKFHPDKGKGNAEIAKQLNEAHDILTDPKKRARYDLELSRFTGNGNGTHETAGQRQYRETREQYRRSGWKPPKSKAYPDAYPRRSFHEDLPGPVEDEEIADGLIEELMEKFATTGQVDINGFLVRVNEKLLAEICKRNPLLGAIIQGRSR